MTTYGLISRRNDPDGDVLETFETRQDAADRLADMKGRFPEVTGEDYLIRPVRPETDGTGWIDVESDVRYNDMTD